MARIAVAGSVAQRPFIGGHAWAFVQYLVGLRLLGHDVVFVDRLTTDMAPEEGQKDACIRWFQETARAAELEHSSALLLEDRTVGLTRAELRRRLGACELLLNFMGFLDDPELLSLPERRAYVDIDPGFPQLWHELGLYDGFRGHDDFVTVALNINRPGCGIPRCGLRWIPTAHPVVLDHWPVKGNGSALTSVGAWRGPYASIQYGTRYGLRVHEFRRFLELPRLTDVRFELALDIDPGDAEDICKLRQHGWTLLSPRQVAGDLKAYQRFVQRSWGEFMVAKNMYVATASGWFGDRSICYLATGKVVIAQDTGLSDHLPVDRGLLTFSSLEEAVLAVEAAQREPTRHARAARAIAEQHFEARKVLRRLLNELGVG